MKVTATKSAAKQSKKSNEFFKGEGNGFFDSGSHFFPGQSNALSPVQAKLQVGQPNDIFEKEADAVADKVVQRSDQPSQPVAPPSNFASSETEPLQKEEDSTPVENLKLQKKPIFESNGEPPDDKNIRKRNIGGHVKESIQQLGGKQDTAPPQVERNLASSKGSGSPLPDPTRKQMESSIGSDFSDVKIHRSSSDAAMNKQLNAQAFTHGKDIYFNDGKYDPQSKKGQHLLAHELTHVAQQRNTVSPKIQRGVVDDVASHLLTGNDAADFLVGVVAGIFEWFGDLLTGIGALLKGAWKREIGPLVAVIGIIIVIVLACFFPEVVIPILMVLGIIAGVISLVYFLYMMTRPGLTPYERGKYLGKAIVEGVLLALTVVEALRTLKVLGEVAKLSEGAGLLGLLKSVRKLMSFGDTAKVIQILVDIGDIEKTIEFLELAKDVEKAAKVLELAGGAGKIDELLALLRKGGITVDDLIDLLSIKGVGVADLTDLFKIPGVRAADLKDLLGRPGVLATDLADLLRRPGITAADLGDLLNIPGVTVADLKDLLRPGRPAADIADLLRRPGMTAADLKDLLGRPGMRIADLKDLLGRPGMTVADLKDLINLADDAEQLKRLLTLVPTIADLKNYFRLAGGHGQGAKLESVLNKAAALGDTHKAEELLNIAAGSATKFSELAEALAKFGVKRAPGGVPIALHGYSAIDFIHLQARHTYEFFDFAGAVSPNAIKDANTLWEHGADIATKVEEALSVLDRRAVPKRLLPFEKPPVTDFLADGTEFQIGANHANAIGQFFPFANPGKGIITFTRQEMLAFKKLLLP